MNAWVESNVKVSSSHTTRQAKAKPDLQHRTLPPKLCQRSNMTLPPPALLTALPPTILFFHLRLLIPRPRHCPLHHSQALTVSNYRIILSDIRTLLYSTSFGRQTFKQLLDAELTAATYRL